MTTVQMGAIRTRWEEATRPEETMSAREMALTSHTLSHGARLATTADGRAFTWCERRMLWVR